MAEDWRLRIALADELEATRVVSALHEREVRQELQDELGGRVAVSRDGSEVFLYADTRRAADAAGRVLREVLDEEHASGSPHLDRWHPIEERWEDASVPLPDTEEERRLERARLDEQEDTTSLETGIAQWEVRVEVSSPEFGEALAEDLELEGRSVVRRSTFLLVGANDRDDAVELAKRLETKGRVHVEPSSGVAWQLMPRNPFAIFGGLGG